MSAGLELRTLARRISFAIIAAGVCFLVLPLRFAFERPAATGWLGTLFDMFRNFDQLYNLFPSLHITLRTLLADLYARHTRGTVHVLVHEAACFIAEQAAHGTVYVHCKIGYSRSVAAVEAYLLASGQAATVADVVEYVRHVRPSVVVRPEIWEALHTFAQMARPSL